MKEKKTSFSSTSFALQRLFPPFSVCSLLAEEAVKAKVEVSVHPAPTDHNPSENWEEKLEGESLPVATASIM